MSYPTFPVELPKPQRSGYQGQLANARRLTTFDSGPPKSSLRHAMVARTIAMTLDMEAWQVQLFSRFYEDTCRFGSVMFWMRDVLTDGAPLLTSEGVPRLNSAGVPLLASKLMLCAWGEQPPAFSSLKLRRERASFQVVEMPG